MDKHPTKEVATALQYLEWAGMSATNHLPAEHNAFIKRVLLATNGMTEEEAEA
jgi:hypothetical protein|tara:strand:+ start:7867 stop:8025 length:159 start_codon:yes stop_codon:yes gene_type:complete